jgi:hypothetical protein
MFTAHERVDMSARDRLREILRRVPLGLGVPGSMDHPTTGGLARDREQAETESESGETDGDSFGETDEDRSVETDENRPGR